MRKKKILMVCESFGGGVFTYVLINEFIDVNNLVNWKLFVNEKNVGYVW